MSTPGIGDTDGALRRPRGTDQGQGAHARGNDTQHSSGASSVGEAPSDDTATREHTHANRVDDTGADDTATRAHTRAVPVSAIKDSGSHTLDPDEHRRGSDRHSVANDAIPAAADRRALHQREKEEFGGMKFGSAFFGWLTATGMAVLLTALLAAAGAVFSLSTNTNLNEAADQASQDAQTVGVTSAIVLLVLLLVSYFAGGYVAGRMARFDGAKQGIAVWLWALIIAVVVAILGVIAGSQFDILANLNSFPRLPINEGDLTTAGVISVVVAALAALIGAILGGLAGMRYHRRIDRADYDELGRS
ncbi:hypothetical protein D6T65_10215 [Arthrobacter frigidicola]|nr:hypothetical protein D6T65_10215 [Arthrobacter frigidicola]